MPTEVKVPDIGDFTDVPVVTILVGVGDSVSAEDPLIELESDKATMEVPSPSSGTVKEIMIAEGDTVSEGTVIMIFDEAGDGEGSDAGSGDEETGSGKEPTPEQTEAPANTPKSSGSNGGQPPAPQPYAGAADAQKPAHGGGGAVTDAGFGRTHASPSVRAFARSLDIDLTKVNGTGRKGRILREDVSKFFKSSAAPAATGAPAQGGMGIPPIPKVDFSKFGKIEDVEMSRIKKLSGPALHRSWLNIPHVTHQEEADITELDKYRKEMDSKAKDDGYRVTLLSFVIKASVSALKEHWEFNSSLHPDGDKLIRKHYYNIGFAADTPHGLVVPVIKDADRKGIVEVSKELGDL